MNETAFGKQVDQYLAALGCFVIRINSGAVKAMNRDGSARFVRFNNQPGCSDRLVCLPDGKFMALELKQGKKKMTPEQEAFLDKVGHCNGYGVCVWTLDQLENVMKQLGYVT